MLSLAAYSLRPSVGNRRPVFNKRVTKIVTVNRRKRRLAKTTEKLDLRLPGWKQISDPNNSGFYKFTWSAIVLVSCVLCIYQITERITLFTINPIASYTKIIQNQSLKFPSLAVCPENGNYPQLSSIKKEIAKKFRNVSHCFVDTSEIANYLGVSLEFIWPKVSTKGVFKSVTLQQNIPIWLNPMQYTLNREHVMTMLGTCTRYCIPELIPFGRDNFVFQFSSNVNYYNCQHVSDWKEYKLFLLDDLDDLSNYPLSHISIGFNRAVKFGLTVRQYNFLNTKANPCSDVKSVNLCKRKCREKLIMRNVKCRSPDLSHLDLPPCKTITEVLDALNEHFRVVTKIDSFSTCNCPRPCTQISYTMYLKSSRKTRYPNVQIYFDDNAIDVVTEYYSYTFIPLLCDIGGNLGLFLGLCIPTLIEIAENGLIYMFKKLYDKYINFGK